MQQRFSSPPGTHDILPPSPGRAWADDVSKWHWLESTFRALCALYGYEEVRTPVLEASELFHRAVGEGTDIVSKETYDFSDRGGRSMTLRPEGTAGVIRAYVQHKLYTERPVVKLCYVSSCFRYERQQKGRYRGFHQAGVEAIGSERPELDAEVIALAMAFFRRLGVERLTLKLNSVGSADSRQRYVAALRDFAQPLLPEMSPENQERFGANALRMLDSKSENDQRLLAGAPSLLDFLDTNDRAHFDALQRYLSDLGVSFEIDDRLVRGFDYYTRTAFEIQSPDVGAQSALAGGGRYDRLIADLGGPPTPGIGWGLGIERTLIALEAAQVPTPAPPPPVVFLCPLGEAARAGCVGLLAQLRQAGVAADMDYGGRKLKTMLEQADRIGARAALIVGDDEVAQNVVQLRDMQTKQQRVVPRDAAVAAVLTQESPNQ